MRLVLIFLVSLLWLPAISFGSVTNKSLNEYDLLKPLRERDLGEFKRLLFSPDMQIENLQTDPKGPSKAPFLGFVCGSTDKTIEPFIEFLLGHSDFDWNITWLDNLKNPLFQSLQRPTNVSDFNAMAICAPKLVRSSKVNIHFSNREQENALHIAAQNEWNTADIIDSLIHRGVNLEQRSKIGRTPIFASIHTERSGGTSKCELRHFYHLLNAGADVSVRDRFGDTLLHNIAKNELLTCWEAFDFLIKNSPLSIDSDGQWGSPLQIVLRHREWKEEVSRLIAAGANINHQNRLGETPLHTVFSYSDSGQNLELIRTLLSYGADSNISNLQGYTPLGLLLTWGAELNQSENAAIEILLENGANPNAETPLKWSDKWKGKLLHQAALMNKIEAAKLLLKHGADRNVLDSENRRPIDYAYSEEMKVVLKN